MMLKNGQTDFENLTLLTPQDFYKVCFAIFLYIYEKVNLEHIQFVFSARHLIHLLLIFITKFERIVDIFLACYYYL